MKKCISFLPTILLTIFLIVVPGCCWNKCLQKCKSCTDCGIVHEPLKPLRTMPVLEEQEVIIAPETEPIFEEEESEFILE